MDLSAYAFNLPEDLIALRPVEPQDMARLLVVHGDGRLEDAGVRDLPRYLSAGDTLVFNDSYQVQGLGQHGYGDHNHDDRNLVADELSGGA